MGQVALGLRSLAVKLAVFFVMASLLAWALGGTLWPRQERVRLGSVDFKGQAWFWLVTVADREPQHFTWRLMVTESQNEPIVVELPVTCVDGAGPLAVGNSIWCGCRNGLNDGWNLLQVDSPTKVSSFAMPDRLAVEQQLARLAGGLEIQDIETIQLQRSRVLDPADDNIAKD